MNETQWREQLHAEALAHATTSAERDRLLEEVRRLRLRAERKHCLKGCEHDQHYLSIEINIGPLRERTVDGALLDLLTAVADVVMPARDDVDMSATLLSAETLGLA